MHKYQSAVSQSETAIKSVADILGSEKTSLFLDYVLHHNEWLIGLEMAISQLVEDDLSISRTQYDSFQKAFEMMNLASSPQLDELRSLVTNS